MTNRDAARTMTAKGLALLATLLTLGPTLLFAAGFVAPAAAHASDALPTQSGGHNDEDGDFWNIVDGMSTKTGFRLVFWWDADEPVAGLVEWGTDGATFPNVVVPIGDPVDSAQMAFFDIPTSSIIPGDSVFFRVRDALSGAVSPVKSFPFGNAWRADFSDGIYEINAVMQIDTEALPDSVPLDQGMVEVSQAMDVLAERIWDASDGYVRLGKVLITDTVLNYPANYVQLPVGFCTPTMTQAGATVGNTLADFIITTQYPFDSHTFKDAINCPGLAFYVGRIGQLVVPWEDELHLGAVMTHEFGHYAFGMDDLYEFPVSNGCFTGLGNPPNNANNQWDISVMSNAYGWSGSRWVGSEFDRVGTPCDRRGGAPSWPFLVARFPGIPALGRLGTDLPDHSDSVYNVATGNADGGALDISFLDNEVLVSKVNHFLHAPAVVTADPVVTIEEPADGAAFPAGPVVVGGNVNLNLQTTNAAPLATLGASTTSGQAPLTVTFSPAASDSDGAIATWSMAYGDGPVDSGNGAPPSSLVHTYTTDGDFSAVLTVTDDLGATAQAARTISVGLLASAVRIGTDPAGDTATSCPTANPGGCNVAWVAGARDGLDIRAAYVSDLGSSLRFIVEVKDGTKFYVNAVGDPTGATDPGTVTSYQLTTQFQTSPGTVYTLNIQRLDGSSSITATLGKRLGVLIANSNLGAASNQGNLFWADIPKSQFPEMAVLKTISAMTASTSFNQRGATVQLIQTMDTLGTIENPSTVVTELELPGYGPNPAAALAAPTSPPSDAQIQDGTGDVLFVSDFTGGIGAPVDHMDVEAAWLENDADYLYLGLKVKDIPADVATTSQIAYDVEFFPEWTQVWPGIVSGGAFTGLRVEAMLSPVSFRAADFPLGLCDGCLLEPYAAGTNTQFELHVMSEDDLGGFFSTLATLPLSSIDAETDILWFVIPRAVLQAPAAGDEMTGLMAYTQQGMGGLFTSGWDSGDFASGPITTYVLEGVNEPLSVDAGGPYTGVVGGAIAVAATPVGGNSPYDCAWSGPAEASFTNAAACLTAVTFSASGDFTLSVTVTDEEDDSAVDTAPATIVGAGQERVEIYVDGALVSGATVPVDTTASNPVADWLSGVDLTGETPGAHDIEARWYDEDSLLLDSDEVTIEVTGAGPPFVTITAPADGSIVGGTVAVTGLAGHLDSPPPTPSGAETVTVKVNGATIDTLTVDTSLGDDSWSTSFDADALGPGTHTVSAEFDDGLGGLADDSVSVEVPTPIVPYVSIDSPIAGSTVALPAAFGGEYSTTGDPPAEPLGAEDASAAGPIPDWTRDAFVQATLTSQAFATLRDQMAAREGFQVAYPSSANGGHIVAIFSGAIPAGLPTEFDGRPIRYEVGVPKTLMTQAGHEARHVLDAAAFTALSDEERREWLAQGTHEGPNGPHLPLQAEIGPGSALQQRAIGTDPVDGQKKLLTFICTASYLFENPDTGIYYLATAGHCLMDEDVVSSVASPAARARYVDICVSDCLNNWLGVGNYLRLSPGGSYHPVAFAHQAGVGRDVGFIEIPEALNEFLRPWMAQWGGPRALDAAAVGDPIVHFGHGVASGWAPGEYGRMGVAVFRSRAEGVDVVGWVSGGDSGSAFGTAFPRPEKAVVGDGASGIVTHAIQVGVGIPSVWSGTDILGGLDLAEGPLGFRPSLVVEDATIRLPGPEDPSFSATIVSPIDGAVIDPLDGRFATITGTGLFPPGSLPGTETRTYWLHRTDCGGTDILYMDEVQGAVPDGGDGCGSLAHPVGYAWEVALGELADVFPADPAPTTTTFFDPIRDVEVTLMLSGYSGVSGNPQPVPTVVSDIEVRLLAGEKNVGSERLTGPLPLGASRPVTFSFPATLPSATAADVLTLVVVVHEAAGPVFTNYGGASGSFVEVPLGADPNSVELSLDDPTFLTGLLPTTGSSSWGATWDLQGALPGLHTLYARARQGASVGTAVDSAAVTLSSMITPPTAGFVPTVDGLSVSFADASAAGDLPLADWAWSFGDGATGTGSAASHTYGIGGPYDVQLIVTDEGGYADEATMSVEVGDDWSVDVRILDPLGGEVLGWTPAADPVDGGAGGWGFEWDTATPPANGAYSFETRLAREGVAEASDSLPFALLVNHAPVLDAVGPQTVAEAATLTLQLTGSDQDGDDVTFAVLSKPAGATFSPSGLFQWTPTYAQAGSYLVQFRAVDELGAFDAEVVVVTVTNTNRAPQWATPVERTVKSGNLLNFALMVTDPDGQATVKSVVSAPSGVQVTFSPTSAVVRWTPTVTQLGTHEIVMSATDGGLTAQVTQIVHVVEDLAPVVALSGPQALEVGPASYSSAGTFDPENKALTYAWELVRDADSAVLATGAAASFAVTYADPGAYTVRLTVRDPQGHATTATLPVLVDDIALLDLSLVGATVGTYTATQQAVIRACATWVLDGAPIVNAAVTMQVTLQGPGTTTVPILTQGGASGTTGDDGCVDVTIPYDAGSANLLGKHRVDGIVVGDSRATDAILNTETDGDFVQYTVTATAN